jgi:hypothetical protein
VGSAKEIEDSDYMFVTNAKPLPQRGSYPVTGDIFLRVLKGPLTGIDIKRHFTPLLQGSVRGWLENPKRQRLGVQ